MARPQKNKVDYFPHYADASQRDTLTILQGKWGNDGYAFWFKLLEKLSDSEGHFINCRNPVKWQLLLARTQLTNGTGEEIMKTLAELGKIDTDLWNNHRVIWCQNLVDNLVDVYRNRKRPLPTKPVLTPRNPVTTLGKPQSKVEDIKLDKKKEEASSPLYLFNKLKGWKIDLKEDEEWLTEFIDEFPSFNISEAKACIQFYSGKPPPKDKGSWKNRFRNWMKKKKEFDDPGRSETSAKPKQKRTITYLTDSKPS